MRGKIFEIDIQYGGPIPTWLPKSGGFRV